MKYTDNNMNHSLILLSQMCIQQITQGQDMRSVNWHTGKEKWDTARQRKSLKKKKQEECEGAFSNMLKIIYKSVNKTKQEKILEFLNTLLNNYISNIKVYFYNIFNLAGDVAQLRTFT